MISPIDYWNTVFTSDHEKIKENRKIPVVDYYKDDLQFDYDESPTPGVSNGDYAQ